jgi:hypothetical protein
VDRDRWVSCTGYAGRADSKLDLPKHLRQIKQRLIKKWKNFAEGVTVARTKTTPPRGIP